MAYFATSWMLCVMEVARGRLEDFLAPRATNDGAETAPPSSYLGYIPQGAVIVWRSHTQVQEFLSLVMTPCRVGTRKRRAGSSEGLSPAQPKYRQQEQGQQTPLLLAAKHAQPGTSGRRGGQ